MPFELYKVAHLFGLFLVFSSTGALALHVAQGGTRADLQRGLVFGTHGIGLLIVLISGFGMLGKLGLMAAFPGWAVGKLVLWLIVGGIVAVPLRAPASARPLWFVLPTLGAIGGWLALSKPF